ncbi:MAG: DSD1 family PLP-dependent enzyme [Pirellulales bacterium]|nr:DSD1 family PLP-dependent enzyme [Pirellulales bacterium]
MNHPAIGQSIHDLDTPALILDLDVSDRNIQQMAQFFRDRPAQLRPHFKNHKCSELAIRQMKAGSAVGMTCANMVEAEALGRAGIDDILIANQILGREKIRRLVDLACKLKISVAIDELSQAELISEAASAAGATVGLLVEVDAGMGRCGVSPGEPALALAKQIIDLPGTEFRGLQAYEGHCVFIDDLAERTEKTRRSMMQAVETRHLLEENGLSVACLSGCSSSTAKISGTMEGMTEVQAGTYATMDWRYHQLIPEFDIALALLATVISHQSDRAVLDAGVKALGAEFGPPKINGAPEADIPFFGAEEHCIVKQAPDWKVGQTVQVYSSHACTTCNLHPQIFVHQNERVVDVWKTDGRG